VENSIGPIRAVDFIYRSQGVNRPLRQRDDDLVQNPRQTVYRDQINKVANAIKESIYVRKSEPLTSAGGKNNFDRPVVRASYDNTNKQVKRFAIPVKWMFIPGIILIAFFWILLKKYPDIFHRKTEGSSGEEILNKAIISSDFYNSWRNYHGKIRLRTVRENGNYSDEIIEIGTKENFYKTIRIEGNERLVKGIKDGKCFLEINGNKKPDPEQIASSGIDCNNIEWMKEHHYCHFGMLMELKASGLVLQNKVEHSKFSGYDCLALTFKGDSSIVKKGYFAGNNFTVFLNPSNYTMRGIQWVGEMNTYVVFSGTITVNGIKMPLCRTYYNSSDNSLQLIDVFSLAE
jgi:hypothetical protein